MINNERMTIKILSSLLKAENVSPVLLLGAGASFRSGLPLAGEAVKQIARVVYSKIELQDERPAGRVKPSEWEPWLQAFPWFISDPGRFAENFPLVVDNLLRPAEFRKKVLLDLMQPQNGLSPGYKVVADFVMRGLLRTILTTNFDTCMRDALAEKHPHIRNIAEVNRLTGDYAEFDLFSKCQIVWLHGKAEQYSDRNGSGEVTYH